MKKNPKIVRQKLGKQPTRHGIVLKYLEPRYKYALMDNYFIKDYCKDDRFVRLFFHMVDNEYNNAHYRKLYFDPKTRNIINYKELQKSYKTIDWLCAMCKDNIKSRMDNFKPENFVCDKCKEIYLGDNKFIPEKILENSFEFFQHCKSLLKEDQHKFLKYIRQK